MTDEEVLLRLMKPDAGAMTKRGEVSKMRRKVLLCLWKRESGIILKQGEESEMMKKKS